MPPPSKVPIWQVDAFADQPFTGNPAAVCVLARFPADQWMQRFASEMNLSETAYVVPMNDAGNFRLRWFTPAHEVDLCGHATLAAAHTLFEQAMIGTDQPIQFHTRSGKLTCAQSALGIKLDFPASPVHDLVDPDITESLLAALGIGEANVLQSKSDLLVIVKEPSTVESLRPNFSDLEAIETRGVIVSAESASADVDFVSRFFAPRHRINEDPVTGSAHCCLAPYWGKRLSKKSLVGYQASPRGGKVICDVVEQRVHLTGTAVTVMEGGIVVDPVWNRS